VGPSNAHYQPHAPPGQAGPSVDRHRIDQPPELSPREQVAAIRAQLAAETAAVPPPASAASGQAGPSVDRRRLDQPPELSPWEQLAAIRAQLAAEAVAAPPPPLQRCRAAPVSNLPPIPAGVQGVAQLQAMANALNLPQHRPVLNPPLGHVPLGVDGVAQL
jgi:hypothetical protein